MSEHTVAGMSRRDLIKKGAIVGGLVWAAPVVTKITPAYGQTSAQCACPSGTTLYRVQYTVPPTVPSGSGVAMQDTCTTAGDNPTCEPACWDAATCSSAGVLSTSVQSNGNASIVLRAGATLISDSSSCSRTANVGDSCTTGTYKANQRELTYSGCQPGEVINVVYCF